MLKSKVFANGSTTLPKPVRDALSVKAGESVRYVISEDTVQIFKIPSEKAHADKPALRRALDEVEEVMDENLTLLRKLK